MTRTGRKSGDGPGELFALRGDDGVCRGEVGSACAADAADEEEEDEEEDETPAPSSSASWLRAPFDEESLNSAMELFDDGKVRCGVPRF